MSDVGKAIGGFFSPPKIKDPAIQATPAMGTFDQRLGAKRKARKDREKRKGRESTIRKTQPTYSGSNLGGTQ